MTLLYVDTSIWFIDVVRLSFSLFLQLFINLFDFIKANLAHLDRLFVSKLDVLDYLVLTAFNTEGIATSVTVCAIFFEDKGVYLS